MIKTLKFFYFVFLRKVCPKCKDKIEGCLVYASHEPYRFCGECGYIFDRNRRGEIL